MVACPRLGHPTRKGAQIHRFSIPSPRPVARLLLSGDVQQNPGPGKKWLCTLCSLHIKTKSQTSIRCIHTTTHWVHLTCTNITATQYTDTWKCAQHSTYTTQTQPPHSKNNTNQSPATPSQTATVTYEPAPTSPPRTPATNILKPRTPQPTSPTSETLTNLPINSTPQLALETCASATTTSQAPPTTNPSTPRTPQIAPATISPTSSSPQTTSTTNHQQPKSTQHNKQYLKILQININGIHKKHTELAHILKTNNIDIATVQETKLANHHKTSTIPQYTTHRTDRTHKKGGRLITFIKQNINFTPLAQHSKQHKHQ